MNNQFSENLKKMRKEHNLSQEQLADKLGVSRQAISKWESGAAYPEMDKIIALCEMFNCNIDDLLHKDIKEVKEEKESKNIINNYINDFLKYVTDTINMFSRMTTGTKIKCIFEQFFIALALFIFSGICTSILNTVSFNILKLFPNFISNPIYNTFHAILVAFFFFASLVIMAHVFKKRYLDYYSDINDTKDVKEKNKEEEKEIKKPTDKKQNENIELKKEEKIIIRDEKHSEYKLVNGIFKAIIIFIKFILFCISLSICGCLVGLFIAFVFSFMVYQTGPFFFGLLSIVLSSASIAVIFLILIYSFILNRKVKKRGVIYGFIISVIMFGVGCGLVSYGALQFKIIDNMDEYLKIETVEHDMRDDLIIHSYRNTKFVEQDIPNVKIDYTIVKYCDLEEHINSDGNEISLRMRCKDPVKVMREYIKLLNKKKVVPFDDKEEMIIYANHDNLEKIKNNLNKRSYNDDQEEIEEQEQE